jgi:hypothetical protein
METRTCSGQKLNWQLGLSLARTSSRQEQWKKLLLSFALQKGSNKA